MSVTIKSSQINYKDPTTGNYVGLNSVAEKKLSELQADLEQTGQEILNDINSNDRGAELVDIRLKADGTTATSAGAAVRDQVNSLSNRISSESSARTTQANTLSSRLDLIEAGTTAADSELVDVRVKADGTTAASAGTAVREQITELKNDLIEENSKNLFNSNNIVQNNAIVTKTDRNTIKVVGKTTGTYRNAFFTVVLKPNTLYTFSCIKHTNSGAGVVGYYESMDEGQTYPTVLAERLIYDGTANDKMIAASFTTTTGYVKIAFFCTYSSSADGDIDYSFITLEEGEYSGNYVPNQFANDFNARNDIEGLLLDNNNIIDIGPKDFKIGGLYNATGQHYHNQQYCTYDYHKVLSSDIILISKKLDDGIAGGDFTVYFYDDQYTFLGLKSVSRTDGIQKIEPLENSAFYKVMCTSNPNDERVLNGFAFITGNSVITNEIIKEIERSIEHSTNEVDNFFANISGTLKWEQGGYIFTDGIVVGTNDNKNRIRATYYATQSGNANILKQNNTGNYNLQVYSDDGYIDGMINRVILNFAVTAGKKYYLFIRNEPDSSTEISVDVGNIISIQAEDTSQESDKAVVAEFTNKLQWEQGGWDLDYDTVDNRKWETTKRIRATYVPLDDCTLTVQADSGFAGHALSIVNNNKSSVGSLSVLGKVHCNLTAGEKYYFLVQNTDNTVDVGTAIGEYIKVFADYSSEKEYIDHITCTSTSNTYDGSNVTWRTGSINSVTSSTDFGNITGIRGLATDYIPAQRYHYIWLEKIASLANYDYIDSAAIYEYDENFNCLAMKWQYSLPSNFAREYYVIQNSATKYVRICIYPTPNANISLTEQGFSPEMRIHVESLLSKLEYKNEKHGVKDVDMKFLDNQTCTYNLWYTYDTRCTSTLVPLPKNGIYVYSKEYIPLRINFYRLNQEGDLVPAQDYPYCYHGNTDVENDFSSAPRFYPYSEGVYFNIAFESTNNDFKTAVHVSTGKIVENGGRLPNLQGAAILGKRAQNSLLPENHSLRIFDKGKDWIRERSDSSWISLVDAYNSVYSSILRISDVNCVVCAPPYSLVARIYKVNHDSKSAEIYEEIFARVTYTPNADTPHRNITGVSQIDFSKYDFEGFAVIGVVAEYNEVIIDDHLGHMNKSMGMLRSYEDVYNSVFVEWKSGISVNYNAGIPSVAKHNINTIVRKTMAPSMQASLSDGGHGHWNTTSKAGFSAYGDVHGWFYSASNLYNVPFMHVTPESFITASKNRHSRVYVPINPDSQKMNFAYGSVCSSTSSLVCGLPSGNETFAYCSRLVEGFEYRDFDGIDSFMPGDIFASGTFNYYDVEGNVESGNYGHVVYITEVVSINGEVFCVNAFEGTLPTIGFRTYINYEAFNGYTSEKHEDSPNEIDLFDYQSSRYWDDREYSVLARLPRNKYKTFRDAYGAYDTKDYAVTSIMCDRGTDSVYCIGEYMWLTVTDGTEEIVLRREMDEKTITLTDYPSQTFTDGIVYNVTGMVTQSGYHEIVVDNEVMESFYVAPARELTWVSDAANNTITISFEPDTNTDKVIAIEVAYYGSPDRLARTVSFRDFDSQTVDGNGKCTYQGVYSPTFCDGITRNATSVRILRKTPYGTYQIMRSASNFKQRAGVI